MSTRQREASSSETHDGELPSSALERLIAWLAFILVAWTAVDAWLGEQVASTRPIGSVRTLAGGGGFGIRLVVETEAGFCPLRTALSAEKGAALVLQHRENGDQYVCDLRNDECAKTTGRGWRARIPTAGVRTK